MKITAGSKVLVTNQTTGGFSEATVVAHSIIAHRVMVAFEGDTDNYTFPENRVILWESK